MSTAPDLIDGVTSEAKIEQNRALYGEHSNIEGTIRCTAPGCLERWPCTYRRAAAGFLLGVGLLPVGSM